MGVCLSVCTGSLYNRHTVAEDGHKASLFLKKLLMVFELYLKKKKISDSLKNTLITLTQPHLEPGWWATLSRVQCLARGHGTAGWWRKGVGQTHIINPFCWGGARPKQKKTCFEKTCFGQQTLSPRHRGTFWHAENNTATSWTNLCTAKRKVHTVEP